MNTQRPKLEQKTGLSTHVLGLPNPGEFQLQCPLLRSAGPVPKHHGELYPLIVHQRSLHIALGEKTLRFERALLGDDVFCLCKHVSRESRPRRTGGKAAAAAHQLAQAAQQTKADKVACHVHERLPKPSVTKGGISAGRVPGACSSLLCAGPAGENSKLQRSQERAQSDLIHSSTLKKDRVLFCLL